MSQSTSQKRPWLAALLAALVTGLGHLYLRRWRRALGWLAVLFGVTVAFVDPAALEALTHGDVTDPAAVAPIFVVGAFSIVDAYVLAHAHNAVSRLSTGRDGELTHCPNCGNELDPEIEFCHWCTTDLDALQGTPPENGDRRED